MKRFSRTLSTTALLCLSVSRALASGGGLKKELPSERPVTQLEISQAELSNSTLARLIVDRFIDNLNKPEFHGTLSYHSGQQITLRDLQVKSLMSDSIEVDFMQLARSIQDPAQRIAVENAARNSERQSQGEAFVPKLDLYSGQVAAELIARSVDTNTIRGAITFSKANVPVPLEISAKLSKIGEHYLRLENIRFEVSGFDDFGGIEPLQIKADCKASEQRQSGAAEDLNNPANWTDAPCGFTYRVNRTTDPQAKREDYFRFIYSFSRN